MRLNLKNNAQTYTTMQVGPDTNTFTVDDTYALPDAPFRITINSEIIEVGKVTHATKTLSNIIRGVEGTTPQTHESGSVARAMLTAGILSESIKDTDGGYYDDIGDDPDYGGVRYQIVVMNGKPYLEVVEA